MNPELLSQLARERLLDLDRARARAISSAAARPDPRGAHAPLRPVGVVFLRVGLWMVGADRAGHVPISATPAR